MMTATKTLNYSNEQTAELVQKYQAGETVEALATVFGKTTRSIVAKLAREKVYKPTTKTTNASRTKKADLVALLAYQCGVEAKAFESLEKANLEVLAQLVDKIC